MKHVISAGFGLVIAMLSWIFGFGMIFAGFMAGGTPGIVLFLIGLFVVGAGTMAGRRLSRSRFI